MSALPTPTPPVNPDTEPVFRAAADGRLLLKQCASCECVIWYPRGICPECGSLDTRWIPASGSGIVYSYTVVRRGEGAYRDAVPYVLAYVELKEGPRVLTNIVDCPPDSVRIGQAVIATFDGAADGLALVRFRPIQEA
jgi:uncharacterized OB-fold protein